MKTLIRSVFSFLLVVFCGYVTASVVGAFWRGDHRDIAGGPTSIEIGLVSGPIHYDFLLPLTPETRDVFSFVPMDIDHADAEWLVAGWGAHGFYTTVGGYSDLSARAIFDGILGDASVVRLDVIGALPPSVIDQKIQMTSAQYDALLAAIRASITHTTPLPIDGYGPTDVFYHGAGRFHILRTCNVWIGEMLRDAGLAFGAWTPIPLSVTASINHFHRN
jgi:uncharacterized protein (TIGR02117 family)